MWAGYGRISYCLSHSIYFFHKGRQFTCRCHWNGWSNYSLSLFFNFAYCHFPKFHCLFRSMIISLSLKHLQPQEGAFHQLYLVVSDLIEGKKLSSIQHRGLVYNSVQLPFIRVHHLIHCRILLLYLDHQFLRYQLQYMKQWNQMKMRMEENKRVTMKIILIRFDQKYNMISSLYSYWNLIRISSFSSHLFLHFLLLSGHRCSHCPSYFIRRSRERKGSKRSSCYSNATSNSSEIFSNQQYSLLIMFILR